MRIHLFAACLAGTLVLNAQPSSREDYHIEIGASLWRTAASGTVQSGIIPIDLKNDLALGDRSTFLGKAVFQPRRRHRIVIEGSPLRFEGDNELARTIEYNNQTYFIRDRVGSQAELNYVFGGYEYSFVHNSRGHLSAGAGVAFLDASGTLRSLGTGVSASSSERVGLPLASVSFRVWLAPGNRLTVSGDLKGMPLGGYGHYAQGGLYAGVALGPFILQAGYAGIDADIHENEPQSARVGIAPRIRGPVFSLHIRDR